jgi:hypothetical protein
MSRAHGIRVSDPNGLDLVVDPAKRGTEANAGRNHLRVHQEREPGHDVRERDIA